MQKINPFLWFNGNVEEAVNFYAGAFSNSEIVSMHRAGSGLPGEKGKVFTATFRLLGFEFYALDGGPMYGFTPAISFFINCETIAETNELWQKLGDGGKELMPLGKYPFSEQFGWVQDKFGLSWQINLDKSKVKIAPFLMHISEKEGKAEEAIRLYTSLFKNSEILGIEYRGPGEEGIEGSVKRSSFILDGVNFRAFDSNTGHKFGFTPAISFFVKCQTQEEVDFFWEKLSEGGRKDRCGWLTDKFGVSWQIIPDALMQLLYDKNPAKSKSVMDAMMKMTKIEIKGLEEAWAAA
jgi:predicted 3-demethylubiquinone-9 3-methyltransferase (glyoxalase superfamily)